MQITTTKLTRAAGLAAVAAGALFIAVQVKHPEITLDFVQSTQWTVRQGMKIAMAVLALAGITGMYLRQVRQIGLLGLVGYLLLSLGYLMMLCVEMIAAVVLPTIARTAPDYVSGVVAVATNSSSTADLGLFTTLNLVVARRLPARRPGVRHRPVPRRCPRPLGGRPARRRRRRDDGHPAAADGQPAPVRRARRHRPDRSGLVAVARAASRRNRARDQHHRAARPGRRPMTLRATSKPTRPARPTGWVPFALVALVALPAVAGSLRVVELAGGPLLLPANPRMTASPLPVVVHVLCAVPYAVLGAFQFSTRLRRRHPHWHRTTGKVVVALGLGVAVSGLWMTLFYARQPGTGELAYLFRLTFGSALAACIVLGFSAIRRGDVATHRAWMTRGYAIAVAAGTQTLTLAVGPALFGPGALTKDLSLGAAWVVNLAIAEAVIRRSAARRAPVARFVVGAS